MAYQIIWSDDAKEDYRDITYYLLDNYSFEVAEKFTETLFDKVQLFEKNPRIGLASRQLTSLRKIVITPQTALYYTIGGNQITIMNLVDTHRKSSDDF
jgi:addiction module RelE/StbE family toxin